MKKLLFFYVLSFLLFPDSIAQISIKGTVIDKDTKNPISDVIVQYGDGSADYVYTDNMGKFLIPENKNISSIIYFQCFGYKPKSISSVNLSTSNIVFLESNPVSLAPIIISPDEADKILEQVMINTKQKLVTEVPLGYLLHFNQSKSSDTLKNEIYMSYTTSLSPKDLKKKKKDNKVPYKYNIVDICRLQKAVVPPTELYGAEYHASHLFSFGKSVNNETRNLSSINIIVWFLMK